MSALGQKQTCAVQEGMSALPPKADMCGATRDVRFVPEADIPLVDQLIGASEYLARQGQAERFGGFQVDQELELGRLINRDGAGLAPLRIWCTSSAMRLSSSARSTA